MVLNGLTRAHMIVIVCGEGETGENKVETQLKTEAENRILPTGWLLFHCAFCFCPKPTAQTLQ